MAHVLKHVPSARGNAEGGEVTQVEALLRTASKNVHGVVDEGGRVTFAGDGDVANAVELGPGIGARLVGPDVVEPGNAIRAAEEVQLVVPGDDRVIRASRRGCDMGANLVVCVWQQNFPAACRGLQRVEVECDEVIKEEALDLATEDVDFGAEDVERVSVAAGRAGALGQGARPVFCGCGWVSKGMVVK